MRHLLNLLFRHMSRVNCLAHFEIRAGPFCGYGGRYQIAAVDPTTAGRAADEVVGLILRLIAETFPGVYAAREVDHQALACLAAFRLAYSCPTLPSRASFFSRAAASDSQVSAIFTSICRSSGVLARAVELGTPQRAFDNLRLFSQGDPPSFKRAASQHGTKLMVPHDNRWVC
jgi:hypothetical protein